MLSRTVGRKKSGVVITPTAGGITIDSSLPSSPHVRVAPKKIPKKTRRSPGGEIDLWWSKGGVGVDFRWTYSY
nr:hypothetical protein [uncultured Pedobacter sp.]